MTNSINEIRHADCIFITGSNTAESHPVISYEVVRAAKRGANVIIVDPRRIPLVDHATLFLQIKPGTDIYVFLAIMHVIIREGWADETFIAERTEGFDAFAATVQEYTPEHPRASGPDVRGASRANRSGSPDICRRGTSLTAIQERHRARQQHHSICYGHYPAQQRH